MCDVFHCRIVCPTATLLSIGVQDSGQLLRGSAYAGAAIVGLYFARRSELPGLYSPFLLPSSFLLPSLSTLPLSHTYRINVLESRLSACGGGACGWSFTPGPGVH